MKKIFLIFLIISLIGFSSAQLGIFGGRSNSNVINLQSVNTSSSSGGSGNVTSVTSSTNCILVNPTVDDVILTFNTSCDTNSGGIISNSSLNAIYLNLSGTNANQNINVGIYNITSNWFKGLFNWISNSPYIIFNGSTASYNETFANNTIKHLISLNNTNTFNLTYDSKISFNNTNLAYLNNTQTFTGDNNFRNITAKNISSSEWIFGKNLLLSLTGTAIFPDTTFNVRTIDVGGGLVSIPAISFTGGAGLTVGAVLDGLYIIPQVVTTSSRILLAREPTAQDVWVFEDNNDTGALQIFRQNPFAGGTIYGKINLTNEELSLNGNNITDYWDGDCPTGNYTYGINNNGTLKCRSDISGGSSSGGDFFFANFTNSFNSNYTAVAPTTKRQKVDIATTSNTAFNDTNMNFGLTANRNYTLDCKILYTGAAATTGQTINLSSTSTTSDRTISYETWSSATAKVSFSTKTMSSPLTGTGSGGAVVYTNRIFADIQATSTGALNLSIRSEVSGSQSNFLKGSVCTLYDNTNN